MKVPTDEQYDVVFANFFLNVFKREPMDAVVRHLAALIRPVGTWWLAIRRIGLLWRRNRRNSQTDFW